MTFSRNIHDIIRERRSCRSYDGRPLEPEHRKAIEEAIAAEGRDHLGRSFRFALLDADAEQGGKSIKLGTYGSIRGASLYLGGAFPKEADKIEGYGYAFEKIILKATELGIGTCWLAGTFDRSSFARALSLKEDEYLPAVTPLGYPSDRRFFMERMTRIIAGSAQRLPWEELFIDGGTGLPLSREAAGPWARALEALRWAPSASNRQPWRLERRGRDWLFFIKRTPLYGSAFPFDIQRSDLGIAMCHFELAAKAEGLGGEWAYGEDPSGLPARTELVASWLSS